jgi:hypothetical protein
VKIDRDVDIGHTETADARGLIRQRLLMGVKTEVDDMADAKGLDIGQLRPGRLPRRGDPIIEATSVVDRFWVGHENPHYLRSEITRPIFTSLREVARSRPIELRG